MIERLGPATTLPEAEWIRRPAPRRVIEALGDAGYAARAVGGCVRDSLLGRAVGDIDLATDATPDTVAEVLRAAGLKVVPTGIDHGTVTAVADGQPVEVTTLRTDVETFGRHAKVEFTEDWMADAARRDFTVNALYADLDGKVFDPVGGWPDLQAGHIRFIGDAEDRIGEDALRILRFFRFYAWFGKPPPDEAALAACRKRRDDLKILSAERIAAELIKLLSVPQPMPALDAMAEAGVTKTLFEGGVNADLLAHVIAREAAAGDTDPMRRLAAWLDGDAKTMATHAETLRLSNRNKARLIALARPRPEIALPLEAKTLQELLYRHGRETLLDLLLLSREGDAQDVAAAADAIRDTPVPELPVKGRDVLALGVPHGPQVGQILTEFENWWIEAGFPGDEDRCRARLAELVEARGADRP